MNTFAVRARTRACVYIDIAGHAPSPRTVNFIYLYLQKNMITMSCLCQQTLTCRADYGPRTRQRESRSQLNDYPARKY